MGSPKTLDVMQIQQLLDALQVKQGTHAQFARGIRNYTIACVFIETGLRVGELVRLKWSDLFFNGEPVRTLVVSHGIAEKGCSRDIPVSSRLSLALSEYYKSFYSGQAEYEPCFYTTWGKTDRAITARQVERIISEGCLKAFGKSFYPHTLRHTFATRLMRRTNSSIVQALLGHKRLTSTQIYCSPSADDLNHAINSMSESRIPNPTHLAPGS